jgi:hypothetical protein
MTQGTQHAPARSPLDKYTADTQMPRVQDAFPAAVIANLDLFMLDEWFNNGGMKLLLIPFEEKACNPNFRTDIAGKLLTTVAEITSSQKVEIALPVPSQDITKPKQISITYLAHYLTKAEHDTMLSQHVWSSEAITFRVIPVDLPCPDFLFTI